MKLIVIFDDTVRKSEVIEDVIGEKGFSEVVVKRQRPRRALSATAPGLFSGDGVAGGALCLCV